MLRQGSRERGGTTESIGLDSGLSARLTSNSRVPFLPTPRHVGGPQPLSKVLLCPQDILPPQRLHSLPWGPESPNLYLRGGDLLAMSRPSMNKSHIRAHHCSSSVGSSLCLPICPPKPFLTPGRGQPIRVRESDFQHRPL